MMQTDWHKKISIVRETATRLPEEWDDDWLWCSQVPKSGVYLAWTDEGLCLCQVGQKGRVRVEFASGAARHRRVQGGGELLAKAVQAKQQPVVWDATGGLGRDAFVLAGLGLQLVVFERNQSVFALLRDGIRRGMMCVETAAILARMSLVQGDAAGLMPQWVQAHGAPDVVYLDPMYPERQKSAAVKKEMAYFHDLVGVAQNDDALFKVALQTAKRRVVVKRPANGMFLCDAKPDYQYLGKAIRFDVYVPHQAKQNASDKL